MPSRVTVSSDSGGFPTDLQFTPLKYLRVLYISFLKGLFRSMPVGNYHWEPGEGSEIHISDEATIKPDVVGVRPAISLTRGPVKFYSLGTGDLLSTEAHTGKKVKAVLIPGVMSINCCSRNDVESETIAWVVSEHLWLLREQLIGSGKFFEIGRQPQISSPSPAEGIVAHDGGEEWYCTVVSSPFQFPRQSQVTPLNNRVLQNIVFELQAFLGSGAAAGGASSTPGGTEYPVQVHICPPQGFLPGASDVHGLSPDPAGLLPQPPQKSFHPLNPSVEVTLRTVRRHSPNVRQPSMGGRTVLSRTAASIPIADNCVEESEPSPPFRTKA